MADLGVSALISLALHIKKASDNAKSNKNQCIRLANRVSFLVNCLPKNNPKASLTEGIETLRTLLNSARDLIDAFTDAKLFTSKQVARMWNANQVRDKFKDLNECINEVQTDLNVS